MNNTNEISHEWTNEERIAIAAWFNGYVAVLLKENKPFSQLEVAVLRGLNQTAYLVVAKDVSVLELNREYILRQLEDVKGYMKELGYSTP